MKTPTTITEKALAYLLFKNGASVINVVIATGAKDPTIRNWYKKFTAEDPETKQSTFDQAALKKFIKAKGQQKLTNDSINALLKHQFPRNQTADAAATRINQLFGADIVEVSF